MRNETSSGTPQVESRTIVLRIAAIMVAYFLASEVFVDELVLRVYRVSHGSPYHIAIHGALIGVTGMLGWWLVIRPIQRVASSEQFLGALHRGLEMADTSIGALAVFGRALGLLGRERSSQLLLADSSQAHLDEVLVISPEHGSACSVDSPNACPAVKRGQMLVFASSKAIDACPKLADRPEGPCSAVCLPINALSTTIGILHVSGAEHKVAGREEIGTLRAVAGEIGTRLGMITAIATSETQAQTDPLTGLLNRRELDNRVRELSTFGVPYSLAILDVDNLKTINDTLGHQAGDRVLRLFARTLEEVVREQDLAGRYGGDEFVAVFPRCSLDDAVEVIERMRHSLEDATKRAGVGAFTCSAGLADTTSSPDLHGVLAVADEALLLAKKSGRNAVADARSPQLAIA
jgi:diguanylate cyclase (GGDEF)-like protein